MSDSTAIIPITAKSVIGGPLQRIDVPQGGSIADMLAMTALKPVGLHVSVNDRLIAPSAYGMVHPAAGDRVFIAIVPLGDDGNKIARSAAMIGVLLLSVYTSGIATTAYGPFAGALAGAATSMAGSLAVNALIPPAVANTPQLSSTSTLATAYSISGAGNRYLPFQPVPKTLGTDRVWPPYAAKPYTHPEGNAQYVYMLFNLGRGPLDVSDLKFGDTSLDNYSNIDVDYGTGAHPPRYFRNATVKQSDLSILLDVNEAVGMKHAGDTATEQTTDGDVDNITVELYSPALYFARYDGSFGKVEVTLEVKYRVHGDTTWIDCDFGNNFWFDENVTGKGNRIIVYGYEGTASRFGFFFRPPARETYDISIRRTDLRAWIYTDHDDIYGTGLNDDLYLVSVKSSLWETFTAPDDMEFVSIRARATDQLNGVPDDFNLIVSAHHPVYTASYPSAFLFHGTADGFAVTNGLITLANKWMTVSADPENYMRDDFNRIVTDDNDKQVSLTDTDFSIEQTGLAIAGGTGTIVEIRMRQTGFETPLTARLYWSNAGHGFTDDYYTEVTPAVVGVWEILSLDMSAPTMGGSNWINNTVTGLRLKFFSADYGEAYDIDFLRVKDDSVNDWTYLPTSNPAWVYADILTGTFNHRAISTDGLAADDLAAWADACETNGFAYNATISGRRVREMMQVVCAAGRAVWTMTSTGQYSVIFDDVQSVLYQVFSPRNSWDYQGHKSFATLPHALRIPFRDATNGYAVSERIVYDDGCDESTATRFETMEFDGITDPVMIYKLGRQQFARARLQPETHSIIADIEYLTAERGRRVAFVHDVPLFGSSVGGRVKTKAQDGLTVTLTLDDPVVFEDGLDYAIVLRTYRITLSVAVNNPGAGSTATLTFDLSPIFYNWIAAGDLVTFGEADHHYQEMIVKTITPMDDLTARLELVDYNADLYDDDIVYGTIPEYDPNITIPVNWEALPPPTPVIDTIVSDESVLIVQANGTMVSQMVVSYAMQVTSDTAPAATVECQYKINAVGYKWRDVPPLPISTPTIHIANVVDLAEYAVRIRFVTAHNIPSDWVATTHTVTGKTSNPPQVVGFSAAILDDQVELRWTASTAPDIKAYELRYGDASATWETATYLDRTDATSYRTPARWIGFRNFFIKALDTSGNPSETATSDDLTIVAGSVAAITTEIIDNNVLLRWTTVPGSLPVDHIDLRKGAVFSSATVIGEKKGTFTTVFEIVSGTYTYWLAAVDTAGNTGAETAVVATVNEPPDYVLNRAWDADFADGTPTNVLVMDDGTAIAPIDTTETVAEHFTNNGAATAQDLIDDGYILSAEPVPTSAGYAEEFDHGAVLTASMVTLTLDKTDFNGGPTITEYLAEKELAGDSYNEGTDNPVYFSSFQFVRDRFALVSDGHQFCRLNGHSIRLDVKLKEDSGMATVTVAADGVAITFNTSFADIISIQVSAAGTALKTAIYDFTDTPNPTGFTAYLFDDAGAKTTGVISWTAKGY